MNTKKIAALFSALMITVVLAGVAYAHWTDSLIIEGEVNTGDIDVGLSACVWVHEENWKPYGKVATAYVEVLDLAEPGPVKHVKVTVENAYPSLEVIVIFDLKNYGSVPVALVEYNRYPGQDWDVAIEQLGEGWYTDYYDGATPWQLDPYDWCCGNTWYWWWHLHVTNDALQDTTYTFEADVVFWNWNEAPADSLGPMMYGMPETWPMLDFFYLEQCKPAYYFP
jgi:hypothetical protein